MAGNNMVLFRTGSISSMEKIPLEGEVEIVEVSTDTVPRQSRRKQGLFPEFPGVGIPRRRKTEGGKDANAEDDDDFEKDDCRSNHDNGSVHSKHSNKTKISNYSTAKSTRSAVVRRKLHAELVAMEELAQEEDELAKMKLERKKALINKRLEVAKATIEEDEVEDDHLSQDLADDGASKVNISPIPQRKVQQWLDRGVAKSQASRDIEEISKTPAFKEFVPIKQITTFEAPQPSRICTKEGHKEESQMTRQLNTFLARQTIPKYLPEFSGKFEEWPMFVTQYFRTTDLLGLSNDENLVRLQKCLKGKAREAVLPILHLPENVHRVMETLELMFGRSEQIIKSMILQLKSTPAPKEGRPETLVQYSNHVANLVSTMKSLRKVAHMMNPQLMEDVLAKLPYQLQFQWCSQVRGRADEPNLEDLSEWMSEMALTVSLLPTKEIAVESNIKFNDNKNKKPVLNIVNMDEKNCSCCLEQYHKLENCKQFLKNDCKNRWQHIIQNKLCIGCFGYGHRVDTCSNKKLCGEQDCEKFHHRLLHKKSTKDSENKNHDVVLMNTSWSNRKLSPATDVHLKVLPVTIIGPEGNITVNAIMDDGSTLSLMDMELAWKLIRGPNYPLCMQWTTGSLSHEDESEVVRFTIRGAYKGSKIYEMNGVRTSENSKFPMFNTNVDALKKKYSHLSDVPFNPLQNQRPLLLIGHDHIQLALPRKHRLGGWTDPIASKTLLGWVIHGDIPVSKHRVNEHVLFHECRSEDELNRLVKESFSTECFGVQLPKSPLESLDAKRALNLLERTTVKIGERYQTGLLWRKDDITLPDSRSAALRRLHCLERRMDKDTEFEPTYEAKMNDFISKGYAVKLNKKEEMVLGPRTWYIPHFPHINPKKPGKVRVVFDAAAKCDGVSLNSCLLTGPDLLNSLPAVLIRFRENRIAAVGDIKEMFPQIEISPEDQESQRFLWRGKDRSESPSAYKMVRMIFGAASSPTSANYVKNLNAFSNKDEFPLVYESIMKNTYMNDHLDGGNDSETFSTHIKNVIEVYGRGGFYICNWSCNSIEVLNTIPSEMRTTGCVNVGESDERPVERVLGLYWNPNGDTFSFRISFEKVDPDVTSGKWTPTKRDVLKLMMSLYDPLGFLAHLIIKAKIFFQKIWRSGVGWDEVIPVKLVPIWQIWLKTLERINSYEVPRCYHFNLLEANVIQLHIFSDASEEAFSSVAYLRIICGSTISTAFVLAKTKVAPLKPLSIPRLELQAAVMGTRLARTIKKELNIRTHSTHFWSDSRIVLCWIRSDARNFKQFVANRIGEILEESDVEQWKWVPTAENVADDATRSDPQCDLSSNSRWLIGPKFLRESSESWPAEPVSPVTDDKDEKKKEFIFLYCIIDMDELKLLPDVVRFSNYQRLIRSTAYVRKLGMYWSGKENTITLNMQDLLQAERLWYMKVQRDSFEIDLTRLKQGKVLENNSRLFKLSVFLDDMGLMRVRGRTVHAVGIDVDAIHPIILDSSHPIILDSSHVLTYLLAMDYHKRLLHFGREAVTNEIKQKFCVLNLRGLVKKILRDCQVCKIKKAAPAPPEMGILPDMRVNVQVRAFIKTGVDFFGPMLVAVGRRREKRYGVIFTCLTVRAIHLELAEDLTTSSTINALRRFIGRPPPLVPEDIYSDNGTNFKGASRELREALELWNKTEIISAATSKGSNWHFIPPASPHMGGCWERMVRSVKVALDASLYERVPREEVLRTLLVEAESLVNSRPLTFVSVDPDDPESLTPNHFLLGKSNLVSSTGLFTDQDTRLRNQWRYTQRLTDYFWIRWVKEFLPTLTRRTKWFNHVEPIKVDDVVVIADPNAARGTWPLAIVMRVFPGVFCRCYGCGCMSPICTFREVRSVKESRGKLRKFLAKIKCNIYLQ